MEIAVHSEYSDENIFYNHVTKSGSRPEDHAPHYHDICEIIFLKSGVVSYMIDGRTYRLDKDTMVFTRPDQWHCIRVQQQTDYERYNILLPETALPAEIYKGLNKDFTTFDFSGNRRVIDIFEKMDFYAKNLEEKGLGQLLVNLTQEVLYNALISADAVLEEDFTQANPLVYKATRYIEENLLTMQGVEQLSEALFVTKSHLHRLFMQHLHITPKQYITRKRLALARKELLAGQSPTRVYEKCGFSDYSTFYRAYKKAFRSAPSEFQQADPERVSSKDMLHRYWE